MKYFFLLLFSCSLLLVSYSCKGIKNDVERITQGYSEQDLKDEFDKVSNEDLPIRITEFLVFKKVTYDNHMITCYYNFEEENLFPNGVSIKDIKGFEKMGLYDYTSDFKEMAESLKQYIINVWIHKDKLATLINNSRIKTRIVLKGDKTGKVVETYITPQEFEDAYSFK